MRTLMSRPAVITYTFIIISAVCLSSAFVPSEVSATGARAAGQRAGCATAVARVQNAVTAETHAYADARRTICQFMSLPKDARSGRPQAINDSMQRKFEAAREETAAAYDAARGCDTSRVKRPEVSNYTPGAVDAMAACYTHNHFSGNDSPGVLEACDRLAEELECANIRVVEEKQPIVEEEAVVTVPDDIESECRDAYLQFKAAEKEQERARKRVAELAPNFGAAGPKGRVMFDRAREDSERAGQKRYAAQQKLKACQALSEDGEAEAGTGNAESDTQSKQKNVRPCNADERAAFARMQGSWRSISLGPNITISGSCEQATGTEKYAEYCERPDATYNTTLRRYEVKFTGRMEGESLTINWTPDSTDTRSTAGSGSCRVSPDGTLGCTGLPCGINAKKQ